MQTSRASDLHLRPSSCLIPARCCDLPANTRRPRSGRLYGWRLAAASRLAHEPNQGCSQDRLDYLYVRYLLACVRPTGSPRLRSGLVCGPSTTETLWKRVPLSHVLHRRRKTISASSLGPRLGPLCTAPTHEHSYYVNWALDRGISATTPGHNTGSRANARPSMPRQSSPRSRGFARFFPLFPHYLQRRGDQNKRKARATSTRGLLADFWLSGCSGCLAVAPPPPSVRFLADARRRPDLRVPIVALAYLAVSRTLR